MVSYLEIPYDLVLGFDRARWVPPWRGAFASPLEVVLLRASQSGAGSICRCETRFVGRRLDLSGGRLTVLLSGGRLQLMESTPLYTEIEPTKEVSGKL